MSTLHMAPAIPQFGVGEGILIGFAAGLMLLAVVIWVTR